MTAVEHGSVQKGPGAKKSIRLVELPEWHGWEVPDEHRRVMRWIESNVIQPVGVGAGQPMRIAGFQRKIIRTVYDHLATFISIPAGNGKTTLMQALALERLSRGDDYVEIDVLATKLEQAGRLISGMVQMIEASPSLARNGAELYDVYRESSKLAYRLTGSKVTSHPAKLSAVQGLNYNLALIDEIGEVPPELVTAMIARLGKRPDQHIIGFGTPGFGPDNMLEEIRRRAGKDELPPGVAFIEFAAEAGASIHDEEQWLRANPAVGAGFLDPASLALKAGVMPEHEFRAYHLGQPVATSGPWLPPGAWARCSLTPPPRDGAEVVLGVWGNYRRQVSVCGASLDGAVFFGWTGEKPADEELGLVLRRACEQWDVLELVHKPHIRVNLMKVLEEEGLPVAVWPADRATDVESTAALWHAISFQELEHDHHELLAEQMARLVAQLDRHGNPRLVESESNEGSAVLAMRAAWWRARALAEEHSADELVVY